MQILKLGKRANFIVVIAFMPFFVNAQNSIRSIIICPGKKILNPVVSPGDYSELHVKGITNAGKTIDVPNSHIIYSVKNKLSSGTAPVLVLKGNRAYAGEGGIATVTAVFTTSNQSITNSLDIVVRPFYRDYHQTLVLKLFMGMEGEPVAKLAKEPLFQKKHDVLCTFEQALEVVRKVDLLTLGIPKIIYLVGWQKGGHDHLYPAWSEVNPRLKRAQDSTALQSLRWLILAGRKYHTTISLHINMVDAYKSSPLWDEYVKKDVIARDTNGNLLTSGIQIKGDSMYNVSYTREWAEGLAQKRIDNLIKMIPELKAGHTIHVDVFVAKTEHQKTISPWHAMPQHGGIDIYKEVETQRKIFKYWRERGFDVTGEGLFWAHPPGEGFYGLQPMAWWYPSDLNYQMETPEYLSARGMTSRTDDGDFRFGSSMHGEDIFQKSIDTIPGFLSQFCRTTLPWYYLSRNERVALINDTLYYSNGIKAYTKNGHHIICKGDFIVRDNTDFFVPALWLQKTIIAYSETGYENRLWKLPADWQAISRVDIYKITLSGPQLLSKGVPIKDNKLKLSLLKDAAVYIKPSK